MKFPHLEKGLSGISDHALRMHLALYERDLAELEVLREWPGGFRYTSTPLDDGRARKLSMLANSVKLHELFFSGLVDGGTDPHKALEFAAQKSFGSFAMMLAELKEAASVNGWGLLTFGKDGLGIFSVESHMYGIPANERIVMAVDGWEHAYWTDYDIAKDVYLDVILRNVDWGSRATALMVWQAGTNDGTIGEGQIDAPRMDSGSREAPEALLGAEVARDDSNHDVRR